MYTFDLTTCPLWRLLVLLADLELEVGADSDSARFVAEEIALRLKLHGTETTLDTPAGRGVGRA